MSRFICVYVHIHDLHRAMPRENGRHFGLTFAKTCTPALQIVCLSPPVVCSPSLCETSASLTTDTRGRDSSRGRGEGSRQNNKVKKRESEGEEEEKTERKVDSHPHLRKDVHPRTADSVPLAPCCVQPVALRNLGLAHHRHVVKGHDVETVCGSYGRMEVGGCLLACACLWISLYMCVRGCMGACASACVCVCVLS